MADSDRNEWETPLDFFLECARRFGPFTLDAASTHENHLVSRYCTKDGGWLQDPAQVAYFKTLGQEHPPEKISDNHGLLFNTVAERVWCNPPYGPAGTIDPWVARADAQAQEGATWVMLLPPSIDTSWFHDYVWDDWTQTWRTGVSGFFPRGRLRFRDPAKPHKVSPPTGNLLVVFWPRRKPMEAIAGVRF